MIEVVERSEWKRSLPQPDHVSSVYWAAAARGELLIQQCPSCGHRQYYPRAMCTACGGATDWLPCSGRGVVHTFTVIRMNKSSGDSGYVVAMIELEEGPLMLSNVTDVDPDAVHIGMPVEVYMAKVNDDVGIPLWRPTAAS
jgi:uncharacterized OB-fold protein